MSENTIMNNSPAKAPNGFWKGFRRTKPTAEPGKSNQPVQAEQDLESILLSAKFPIRNRATLIAALGGKHSMVQLKGNGPKRADELADLCFAERQSFGSPKEVVAAAQSSSWTRAVIKGMNLSPLPITKRETVSRLVGRIRIRDVTVEELTHHLSYPISTTAQLVEQLAKARELHGP